MIELTRISETPREPPPPLFPGGCCAPFSLKEHRLMRNGERERTLYATAKATTTSTTLTFPDVTWLAQPSTVFVWHIPSLGGSRIMRLPPFVPLAADDQLSVILKVLGTPRAEEMHWASGAGRAQVLGVLPGQLWSGASASARQDRLKQCLKKASPNAKPVEVSGEPSCPEPSLFFSFQ